MSRNSWSQSVSCRDVGGRDRQVMVHLDNREIVLVSPPGEIARLSIDESMLLRAALTDAERAHEQE
ncbi:hypothetical protein [Kibdelosporangium aridum]|uniref:hypothetical protein n=1 Tax=Kibdelosporangium aridum TaxID=2030 RepID=UPI000526A336